MKLFSRVRKCKTPASVRKGPLMRKSLLQLAAAFSLIAAAPPGAGDTVDLIARDYAVLSLGAQLFAPDLIAAAKSSPALVAEL
jgi:hypothetical protein